MSKSQEKTETKRLRRPSKYKPEYCEILIQAGKRGETLEMIADSMDVHRDTLHEWSKVHPEFSDAMKRCKQAQEAAMQKIGIQGMMGKIKGFNGPVWQFWMKARFRYQDNPDQETEEVDIEFV